MWLEIMASFSQTVVDTVVCFKRKTQIETQNKLQFSVTLWTTALVPQDRLKSQHRTGESTNEIRDQELR